MAVIKPWWEVYNHPQFEARLKTLSDVELEATEAELSAALAFMQAELELKGKEDMSWWRQARCAAGHLGRKRNMTKAALARRRGGLASRVERLEQVIVSLEQSVKSLQTSMQMIQERRGG
jgi:hypothetical protein